jgi:microcystin-dependent protein
MSDPFLGEIRLFGFGFAPQGWAACNGQLLPINQNQALFTLLGTNYGGDGLTNFALPNLQSRVPVHQGHGTGLTSRPLGQAGGAETVSLTTGQMPQHSHAVHASAAAATSVKPGGRALAHTRTDTYAAAPDATTMMDPKMIGDAGSGHPHQNLQPFLVLNFCIALSGIFPSAS